MGQLKKYDPRQVIATWHGIELTSGIIKGTFISVSRTDPSSGINKGGDGGSTMIIRHDYSGTAEITLRAGSDTNERISNVLAQDEADPDQKVVDTFEMKDFNGTTLCIDPEAYLMGPPAVSYGVEEENRAWTLILPNVKIFAGSSNKALSIASVGNV